ncbi:Bcr/CflA family efflux MFS transporter [Reinekea thalattae]|uniref:Bcr/CflA family efflux transporter n=1 Tax=Reinekea thalattae TaxID=2593301 RepID=A0A5C8Z7Q1_9GAMM|nr:Bcr/CflA family efflux MFS transporter [Reinekea thalattae]TXR53677.1 multidrug effflux MFS transporter [Reinekea thalattae]
MKTVVPFGLVLFLAGVFALGPFATDSYLAAIPHIADDLAVSTSSVALTVSIYVFAMAIGQLIGGPLCDRAGRRRTVILGLALFILGGFVITAADSLTSLYSGRIIQAIGGGIAFVCVPAIIRDNASGKEAAKLFTLIALIMMVAPSIAPSFGTLILKLMGWHWIFILMSAFAIVVAVAGLFLVPNSYQYKADKSVSIVNSFIDIFNTREARKYVVIQAATYSVLMIFLTNSSMIYIENYGLSETLFSSLFILNTAAGIIVNRLNSFLLNRYSPEKLLSAFVSLQVVGLLILLTGQLVMPENWLIVVLGFVIAMASLGGILGNSNACFMSFFSSNTGVASSYLGATQSIASAVIAALSTLLITFGLGALALLMLGLSVTALLVSAKANQQAQPNQGAA